jgi:hypothetical protein
MAVMIGVDPHKATHTAVAIDESEQALTELTIRASAAQMHRLLDWAEPYVERTWAIEGAGGLGYLLAQQLVSAGERVVDVQPKLAARVRLLQSGKSNKNDPNDARSIAVAALRSRGVKEVGAEDHAAVLRVWAKRNNDLGRLRNKVACRLHSVLCELVLAGLEPAGAIEAARVELAQDLIEDLVRLDEQMKASKKRIATAVTASGTTLTDLYGVDQWSPPWSSATPRTWVGSRPRTATPPTPGLPRSRCPQARAGCTASPSAATVSSTTPSTSWPSPRSDTGARKVASTLTAKWPKARPAERPCER